MSSDRAFAEFERALIKERQREGIELAKSLQSTKEILTIEQVQEFITRAQVAEKKTSLSKDFGINIETFCKYLK